MNTQIPKKKQKQKKPTDEDLVDQSTIEEEKNKYE